jgi:catechol 2,3-dioxygenase
MTAELGHVVLQVRSLARSLPFYRDLLGLRLVTQTRGMAFLTSGRTHHELALLELGPAAPDQARNGVGLYHVAFKVGDTLEQLRRWRRALEDRQIAIEGLADHRVSKSLYVRDPDGILIELYVDADVDAWRDDPSAVATVGPLRLS